MRSVVRVVVLLLLLGAMASAWAVERSVLEGTVVRVVDGDTIHVRIGGRVERVRYIGVNTPELHHPTLEARNPEAEKLRS